MPDSREGGRDTGVGGLAPSKQTVGSNKEWSSHIANSLTLSMSWAVDELAVDELAVDELAVDEKVS
jgi:hypothetical protein